MRVSFRLIPLAILFSSAFVSAGPAPDNNGGTSCSTCWVEERNKIPQCKDLPKAEVDEFSQLSDQQIISKKDDFPHLIPCLCALVPKVPSIVDKCDCSEDYAKNLMKEGEIVKKLCADIASDDNKPASKPTNTTTTNNSNTNNNKPGGGTGDDSTSASGSGDGGSGDGSTTVTNTTTDGSNPASPASAAVSAQWAGSLIVTLGAAVVAVVAL